MSFYEWDETLSVHHSKIDADHKKIIEKARELTDYMLEGKGKELLLKTLDFLNDYVKTHFYDEEELQRAHFYPRIEEHIADHEYFLDHLATLTIKIQEDPSASDNILELNKLITGWFFKHIQRFDRDLARHIREEQYE